MNSNPSPICSRVVPATTAQELYRCCLDSCTIGEPHNGEKDRDLPIRLFVWGDSHAHAALPAFDEYLKENGAAGAAATHSSTPPLLNYCVMHEFGLGKDSFAYNEAVFSWIQQKHIPDVVLVGYWGTLATGGMDRAGNPETCDTALLATVRRLVGIGVRPWVMLDVPFHPFNVPRVLSGKIHSADEIEAACAKTMSLDELQVFDPEIFAEITAAGGRILDSKSEFLDPTGRYYRIESGGTALYLDGQHLTTRGAKRMLVPLLRKSAVLQGASAAMH